MSKYLGTLTLDLIAKVDGFSKNMDKARQKMEETTKSIERSAKSASDSVKGMLAVGGGYLSVSTLAGFADAYTQIANRIKLVTDTSSEFNVAMDRTYKIAQKTRTSWAETAQVYQRFMQVSDQLGISQKKVGEITEIVSKTIAISGTSAESAKAALMQFGQAMGAGVLRGDELNSVAEQSPALFMAIAKGLGVTTSALRKFAGEGKLTSKVVMEALENAKESVDEDFASISPTLSQAAESFKTSATKIIGEAGTSSGALSTLAESIIAVGNNLDTIISGAMVVGVGLLTKAIGAKTLALKADIATSLQQAAIEKVNHQQRMMAAAAENAALITKLKNNIAAEASEARLAGRILQSAAAEDVKTAAIGRSTAALVRKRAAEFELRAAQKESIAIHGEFNKTQSRGAALVDALGGKLGLLSIAVTAVAGAYFYFTGKSEEAKKALYENSEAVNYNKKQWEELNSLQREKNLTDIKDKLKDQNEALDEQADKIAELVSHRSLWEKNLSRADWQKEALAVTEKLQKETISYAQAAEQLAKIKSFPPERRKELLDAIDEYNNLRLKANENVVALNLFGIKVEIAGNKTENAARASEEYKNKLELQAKAARNAAQANDEYSQSLKKDIGKNDYLSTLMGQFGFSQRKAELYLEARTANAKNKINGITAKQKELIEEKLKSEAKLEALQNRNSTSRSTDSPTTRSTPQVEDPQQYREQLQNIFETDFDSIVNNANGLLKILDKAQLQSKAEYDKYKAMIDMDVERRHDEYMKNFNLELNQYRWSQREKASYAYEMDKRILENNTKLTETEKQLKIELLKDVYDREIEIIEKAAAKRRDARFNAATSQMGRFEDIKAKKTLSPQDYAQYQLGREQNRALAGAADDNIEALRGISEIEDAKERDEALLAQERLYNEQKLLIAMEFKEKQDELDKQQEHARMQLLEGAYASFSNTWGGIAEIIKQSGHEQSNAYAAMIALQKGFAVTSSLIAAHQAYVSAFVDVTAVTVAQKFAGAAAVMAALMPAISTIASVSYSGQAHAGIDNIPREGTWLLDKGERVLSPRQNQDLTSYLSNKNKDTQPQVTQQPNIRIVNSFDESELRSAMATPQGERVILNVIKRNRTALGI